ncbi:MAG: UvrB/UvrC motif-containing protein, partial [Planctomycetes bacterium]|nr:UvrB/UvrC motif-containing protein [Planctomycetota bacterium]
LIQTCGRAARNADGRVILYADKRTDSIEGALAEMDRRRTKQTAHNEEHGLVPQTIVKPVRELLEVFEGDAEDDGDAARKGKKGKGRGRGKQKQDSGGGGGPSPGKTEFADHRTMMVHLKKLRAEMMAAAKNLDFELAARIRDEVFRLEKMQMELL